MAKIGIVQVIHIVFLDPSIVNSSTKVNRKHKIVLLITQNIEIKMKQQKYAQHENLGK